MNPRPQLHATALNIQCGEAFRRRYLEGEIIPPGVAALVGSATDRAVTKNLQHKIETTGLLDVAEVADVARDSLEYGWRLARLSQQHPKLASALAWTATGSLAIVAMHNAAIGGR